MLMPRLSLYWPRLYSWRVPGSSLKSGTRMPQTSSVIRSGTRGRNSGRSFSTFELRAFYFNPVVFNIAFSYCNFITVDMKRGEYMLINNRYLYIFRTFTTSAVVLQKYHNRIEFLVKEIGCLKP